MTDLSRRHFLGLMPAIILAGASRAEFRSPGASQSDSSGGGARADSNGSASDRLQDPTVVGRRKEVIDSADNDPTVIGLERKLRCTCGCAHDIYTCRTTDSECEYAPELHKMIVAKLKAGQTVEMVQAAMVAEYGQKMLMAPEKRGFNLLGYFLPGAVITAVGATLLVLLSRRTAVTRASNRAAIGVPPVTQDPRELEQALKEIDS